MTSVRRSTYPTRPSVRNGAGCRTRSRLFFMAPQLSACIALQTARRMIRTIALHRFPVTPRVALHNRGTMGSVNLHYSEDLSRATFASSLKLSSHPIGGFPGPPESSAVAGAHSSHVYPSVSTSFSFATCAVRAVKFRSLFCLRVFSELLDSHSQFRSPTEAEIWVERHNPERFFLKGPNGALVRLRKVI